jgi:hypothetical protein
MDGGAKMNQLKLWAIRAALAFLIVLIAVGFAYSFPVDIAFLMAMDLATWIEAAVAVTIATQVIKIRPMLTFLRARFFSRRGSGRRVRAHRARREKPVNEDEPPTRFRFAA